MQDQSRNLIIALILGVGIIVGAQILFLPSRVQQVPSQPEQWAPAEAPGAVLALVEATVPIGRDEALAESERVPIETPSLRGSINLTGARIDDLELLLFRERLEIDSPNIKLLSPSSTEDAYFSEFGWLSTDAGILLPDSTTLWRRSGARLTPEKPLTLTWENGQGLSFTNIFTVDEDYLFTVTRRVENSGDLPVTLWPYGLISRFGTGDEGEIIYAAYLVHIGAVGVFDGTLEEMDYEDMREEGRTSYESTGGWIGVADKYWLVALFPDQTARFTGSFLHSQQGDIDKYQVDIRRDALTIPAGGEIEVTDRLFAGAKKVKVLDRYEDSFGVPRLRSVVFKFLWFMAKPLFYAVDFFNGLLGNFGLAILALTVCVRLLLFPLANKSYIAMSKMKKLQPRIVKLRERLKGDKPAMNKAVMALYKREKVNPMAGCLPILIQIPIFFALYSVLFVTIEMRHAPFFGWINDLSAPDPLIFITVFGLLDWPAPNFLMIGIWPVLMGFTMWLQFRLNPTPMEPIQAKIMMFLPIVFTFILAPFPAGLVIYWTWNNMLSITQQWIIMRRMGVAVGFGRKAPAPAAASNPAMALPKRGGGPRQTAKGGSRKRKERPEWPKRAPAGSSSRRKKRRQKRR